MQRIRLPGGEWTFDDTAPLGKPGGFGAVFRGTAQDGQPVAVKRLHLDAGAAAHRELKIANDLAGRHSQHVIPILDAGQDAESEGYYVVMPIAEQSLADQLSTNGPTSEAAAAGILAQVGLGLQEVQDIVHRDLKPANVLLLRGSWCVADFGIAKFVEESTSEQTLKDCLSPSYAAPEQWLGERATSATDIYALGCIAYELLTGAPPFGGSISEIREQHLHAEPRVPPDATPQMRSLLIMMLRKTPAARPSLARVLAVLGRLSSPTNVESGSEALERLANVAAKHEQTLAQADAAKAASAALLAQRNALAREARRALERSFDSLAAHILAAVPTATAEKRTNSYFIRVGTSQLELDLSMCGNAFGRDAFPRSQWDVIGGAAIEVTQHHPVHKRAASLWYTRRADPRADYRWYECGYEGNPFTQKGFEHEPAAVNPELADRAHAPAMDLIQPCYPPIPIDDEDEDVFLRRWIGILAAAGEAKLQHLPRHLPATN